MLLVNIVTSFLLLCGVSYAQTEQQYFGNERVTEPWKTEVLHSLELAEIIPTVISHRFEPFYYIEAIWSPPRRYFSHLGNTISPKRLQHEPWLNMSKPDNETDRVPSLRNIVIALTDPDAPSRDNPKWSQVCHWLGYVHFENEPTTLDLNTIALSSSDGDPPGEVFKQVLMTYKPPGPPPKTGKHRYVLVMYVPKNGTDMKLSFEVPKDRQRWGYGYIRAGAAHFAEKHGLEPIGMLIYSTHETQTRADEYVHVAANFIYSQHKKQ